MSYLGFNEQSQQQLLIKAESSPIGTRSDVGFFSNALGAAGDGLYSGLVAKPDQLLWAGVDAAVSPIARFINENTSLKDNSPEFIAYQRKLAEQQVRRLTPDAATTGTAGLVLNGLFDMGGQAIAGTLLSGPLGGAAAVTSLQGFSEFERLRKDGVDYSTAQDVALIQGLTAGAGTLLPMSLGLRAGGALAEGVSAQVVRGGGNSILNAAAAVARAAPDIAYAAGTNLAFGMAQRGLTASTLRNGGYEDMAAQYDVFDRQSMAIDAVLGVAFGGIGRFVNARGERANAPTFAPEDVDAALAANAAHHAEIDIAPGVPINVLSRDAHNRALQQAMRNVSEGNPVDIASIIEPAQFSGIPGRRNLISQSIDETIFQADEGSAARAVETRQLESDASQILPRGDRKVWESEVANSDRIIGNLNAERASILAEQPSGSGKSLAKTRADKQARLRDVDQRIEYSTSRLRDAQQTLERHEPGGTYFEARAELARRRQAESVLDAHALSFFRTPDVRSGSDHITGDLTQPVRDTAVARQTETQIHEADLRAAEDSITAAPDMMVTIIDADGNAKSRSAREVLDEANRENEYAIKDSSLFDVAVACFLRG